MFARSFFSFSCGFVVLYATAISSWAQSPSVTTSTATNNTSSSAGITVDEKKLPEWVKKQAANPMRWIIDSDNKKQPKAANTTTNTKTPENVKPTSKASPSSTVNRSAPSEPDKQLNAADNAEPLLKNTPSTITPTASSASSTDSTPSADDSINQSKPSTEAALSQSVATQKVIAEPPSELVLLKQTHSPLYLLAC